MLSKFLKNNLTSYVGFLKDEKSIFGKKPVHVIEINDDVKLEMYLTSSANGDNTWYVAVIAVLKGWYTVKIKFDSGRICKDESIVSVANEVKSTIDKFNIDWFRQLTK